MTKQELYCVRHGQTDYNTSLAKLDHEDVSLNETERKQALEIAPLVQTLSVKTISCSPLKRACETKALLIANVAHLEIPDLRECSANTMALTEFFEIKGEARKSS